MVVLVAVYNIQNIKQKQTKNCCRPILDAFCGIKNTKIEFPTGELTPLVGMGQYSPTPVSALRTSLLFRHLWLRL